MAKVKYNAAETQGVKELTVNEVNVNVAGAEKNWKPSEEEINQAIYEYENDLQYYLCQDIVDDFNCDASEIVDEIKSIWSCANMRNYWVNDEKYTELCLQTAPLLMKLKNIYNECYDALNDFTGCSVGYEDGFYINALNELADFDIINDSDFEETVDEWINRYVPEYCER